MDLMQEAQRLRVDQVAVDVDRCLHDAGIPHALLKGATTAEWLYDQPRFYVDVDVLVPLSRIRDAMDALAAAGIAAGGRAGSLIENSHSVELRGRHVEVDLHSSLSSLPPAGDALWEALAPHVQPYNLGVGTVAALDEVGRCLVLTFHAISGGERLGQRSEDLRRALDAASPEHWAAARAIAVDMGAEDLFVAGLTRADCPLPSGRLSVRANLALADTSPEAMSLDRLMTAPRRTWPRLIARELWPTTAFMRSAYPRLAERRGGVPRARLTRWGRLIALSPEILAAYRKARRP